MANRLDVVNRIPGGLIGCNMGEYNNGPNQGAVTVDVIRITEALRWLANHRCRVLSTKIDRRADHLLSERLRDEGHGSIRIVYVKR